MLLGFTREENQGGLALGAVHGLEQAVDLLVEFIIDQHVATLALIQLVTDIALVDAGALQQVDLFKAAGTVGLIESAHDLFRF